VCFFEKRGDAVVERRAMVDGIRHTDQYWMLAGVDLLHATRARPPGGSRWYAAITTGRDFLIGLAYAAGILPFAMLGGFLGTALIYGSVPGPIPSALCL
jgi:hypothetical protein